MLIHFEVQPIYSINLIPSASNQSSEKRWTTYRSSEEAAAFLTVHSAPQAPPPLPSSSSASAPSLFMSLWKRGLMSSRESGQELNLCLILFKTYFNIIVLKVFNIIDIISYMLIHFEVQPIYSINLIPSASNQSSEKRWTTYRSSEEAAAFLTVHSAPQAPPPLPSSSSASAPSLFMSLWKRGLMSSRESGQDALLLGCTFPGPKTLMFKCFVKNTQQYIKCHSNILIYV